MERGLIVSAAVVFGAYIAMPQAAAAQREPTASTRTAVLNDASCAVKIYVKNTAGDDEIIQNGSTVWSSLRPPKVYALVFVYNKGPRHVTVYTWAIVHKTVIDRDPLNMADFGKGEFVNSFGQPLPPEPLYVLESIEPQGSKVLGPYWINSESRTTRFYV